MKNNKLRGSKAIYVRKVNDKKLTVNKKISKINQINYCLPPLELLDYSNIHIERNEMLIQNAQKLQRVLYSFNIKAKVENIIIGPAIIIYEIRLEQGISVSKIKNLRDDIAFNLEAKIIDIRIIAKKQLIAIEVEKEKKDIVKIGEIIRTDEFINNDSKLLVALGKDIYGRCKVMNIKELSHILVTGTTGSGKSMFLHILINSILFKANPSEVKFIMIDTNMVEFSIYEKLPHLLVPIITNSQKALAILAWLCQEMDNRYRFLADKKVKNIEKYNSIVNNERLPYIILIIDKYEDLISIYQKEIEEKIYLLIRKSSTVGIYIIISTGRSSIDTIKGIVKANISTRISFKLPSQIDSKVVLDKNGAERLFKNGDMLLKTIGSYELTRYHCAFISNDELRKVINYIIESSNR